jgi:aspartyl-tRNA(Asn)/glutamyl-tRNA(Gln) amidotransferase subunit B
MEREFGLTADTAHLLAFRGELGDYYEAVVEAGGDGADPKAIANWVTGDLVARIGEDDPAESKLTPAAMADLIRMVGAKEVAQAAAREVLGVLVADGGEPAVIVAERGLGMADSGDLAEVVARAMEQNADAVEKIKAGNDKAIGAIIGAVMKETQGRADGGEVQRLVREAIGN